MRGELSRLYWARRDLERARDCAAYGWRVYEVAGMFGQPPTAHMLYLTDMCGVTAVSGSRLLTGSIVLL